MLVIKAVFEDKIYWLPLSDKEKAYILGSREDCDFYLPFKGVSRKHCEFYYKKGDWWVKDLNSTNGVYLNGAKILEERLKEEDVLVCGTVSLKILKKPTSDWITTNGENFKIVGYSLNSEDKKKSRTTDSFFVEKEYDYLYNKCCNLILSEDSLFNKFNNIMEIMGIENLEVISRKENKEILIFSRIKNKDFKSLEFQGISPDLVFRIFPELDEKKKKICSICLTLLALLKIGADIPLFEKPKQVDIPSPLGISGIAKKIWELALVYRDINVPILVTGETGVGKEIFSRALFYASHRAGKPIIALNISEFPESLRQTEIFGIEEKIATGVKKNIGKFEQANGGAIILDEVGDMPKEWQIMLLRILENSYFYRVGGTSPVHLDVRFFFLTNKNMEEEAKKGNIRDDFFYRINGVHFHIPPLRERKEDIPFFLEKLLDELNSRYNTRINFSLAAWNTLLDYSWPGNIREMKLMLEKAFALALNVGIIQEEMLEIRKEEKPIEPFSFQEEIEKLEKELILKALKASKNISEAIKLLGISRATFYLKAKKYKIKF